MGKKTKAKASSAPIPKDRQEASSFIAEMGRIEREVIRIDANLKDELAAIKERVEEQALPLVKRKSELFEGLQIYCEANREELTGGKTKTVSFPAGTVSWRSRPPKVNVRAKLETIIAALREKGLRSLLRVTYELNKEAILAAPAKIEGVPGISIASAGEDFAVEPFSPEGVEAAQ